MSNNINSRLSSLQGRVASLPATNKDDAIISKAGDNFTTEKSKGWSINFLGFSITWRSSTEREQHKQGIEAARTAISEIFGADERILNRFDQKYNTTKNGILGGIFGKWQPQALTPSELGKFVADLSAMNEIVDAIHTSYMSVPSAYVISTGQDIKAANTIDKFNGKIKSLSSQAQAILKDPKVFEAIRIEVNFLCNIKRGVLKDASILEPGKKDRISNLLAAYTGETSSAVTPEPQVKEASGGGVSSESGNVRESMNPGPGEMGSFLESPETPKNKEAERSEREATRERIREKYGLNNKEKTS